MPGKEKNRKYIVRVIYDTETSNILMPKTNDGITLEHVVAYPILYIANVLNCTISEYEADTDKEQICYYRYGEEFIKLLNNIIDEANGEYIPVVCAYNLMFDLQPILYTLRKQYLISVNAQSSRNAYTVDLLDDNGTTLLRFWDTSHLEPRGLWAMGEAVGLSKATGDWDYNLVRTPETPLTHLELFYAKRDVQVIPAYLRYLLEANTFLNEEDLGVRLLTKTSLVRLLSKRVIGTIEVEGKNKTRTLETLMRITCKNESPKTYEQYALRKACFRGGLTFTAAKYASKVQHNVISVDAVSMHHAHLNGMAMGYNFKKVSTNALRNMLIAVKRKSIEDVLEMYERPFSFMFHVKVKVTNIRLKEDSLFSKAGIATLAEAKFTKSVGYENFDSERAEEAELAVKKNGYQDYAKGSKDTPRVYAYSKLYSSDTAIIHVTEIEWYIFNLVYDYDEIEVLEGEATTKLGRAPEYVTLLSNMLYKQKDELKQILKTYKPNEHNCIHDSSLPKHITAMIESGTASKEYLESYYKNIIKGSYNSIYGSQAQDVYKPSFTVTDTCEIEVDKDTVASTENFADLKAGGLVLYTYGMRIVGRSRLHLVLAMYLLDKALGDRIQILGGDTDSLKIATDSDVTDEDIINALMPLHYATRNAIKYSMLDVRKNYPELASNLDSLGEYEIETYAAGKYSRYKEHIELWNKCRISLDMENKVHITCAGVSRPDGYYNLENLAEDMIAEYGTEVLKLIAGYNVFYDSSISYLLAHSNPAHGERIQTTVTDYLGNTMFIDLPQSIGLEPCSKTIGETLKLCNKENLLYKQMNGENIDTNGTDIWIDEENAYILYAPCNEKEKLYKVKRNKRDGNTNTNTNTDSSGYHNRNS